MPCKQLNHIPLYLMSRMPLYASISMQDLRYRGELSFVPLHTSVASVTPRVLRVLLIPKIIATLLLLDCIQDTINSSTQWTSHHT